MVGITLHQLKSTFVVAAYGLESRPSYGWLQKVLEDNPVHAVFTILAWADLHCKEHPSHLICFAADKLHHHIQPSGSSAVLTHCRVKPHSLLSLYIHT